MEGVRRGGRRRERRQQLPIAIQPRAGAKFIFGPDPQNERQRVTRSEGLDPHSKSQQRDGYSHHLVSARMNTEKATKNDGQHVSMRRGP